MDTTVAFGIGGLALVMAGIVTGMVRLADPERFPRIATIIVAVMAIQFVAAKQGLLRHWEWRPPVLAPMMVVTFALTVALAFSKTGDALVRRFSLSALIGIQVFRLPLELFMHRAATHGIMPGQMTFSGYNFDILSGALALPVAWIAGRVSVGRTATWIWNLTGSVLLAGIVAIAALSVPRIAAFGPGNLNTFVADPPYVWLPGVLVPCALLGHLLAGRSLAHQSTSSPPSNGRERI